MTAGGAIKKENKPELMLTLILVIFFKVIVYLNVTFAADGILLNINLYFGTQRKGIYYEERF